MERIVCLVIGYFFGSFETGYIYGKLIHHKDIRDYGSHNSGATNAGRVMGRTAGIIVFLGDALKTILACLLILALFHSQRDMIYVYFMYTGLGVIIGHNYPFYMGFKGGKGIAATAGLMPVIDIRIAIVCTIVFGLIVLITRYVSVGSMVVVSVFAGMAIFFAWHGDYGIAPTHLWEFTVLAILIALMGIYRHHANIVRLIHGNENKVGQKKKEENKEKEG